MNNRHQISVLGCGWLGFDLAKTLIKDGHSVKGSTTSATKLAKLRGAGINPFLISLSENEVQGPLKDFVKDSTILIINVPPGLRRHPNKNHFKEIHYFISAIRESGVEQLIFISSTSVFEDRLGFPVIDHNESPDSLSSTGQQLIAIEDYLMTQNQWNTIIIRPGGLIGKDRHPAHQLSGCSNLKNPEAPINLIHRRDLIASIKACIELNVHHLRLNVVYPYHPSKEEYYSTYCQSRNLPLPSYNSESPSKGKTIDNSKTEQLLNIQFSHRP